ncbi:hypothetical protein NGC33_27400, partial [Klebsiella pneumoniae]|nr:hypothetical protein [Klebsiella pneumoniae]
RSYLTWSAIMNMIFELIGLLLVVGCAFFTTFFLAAVAGTMVVIFGWGISIVTPKVDALGSSSANQMVINSSFYSSDVY